MQSNNPTKKRRSPEEGFPAGAADRVRCSTQERDQIFSNARQFHLTASEYLQLLGLFPKIEPKHRILPKEVLLFSADLNHIGSNLNQIAKKRNGIEPLSSVDRKELLTLKEQLSDLVVRIKSYFR